MEHVNPPANPSPPPLINLKVRAQNGSLRFFKIKRDAPLKKLMSAYYALTQAEFKHFEFLFDGRRLRGGETPQQLEMEDGDEIDAMQHQYGSGGVPT